MTKIHAFRLQDGEDLKLSIIQYVKENNIKAGCILACVGWLKHAVIRLSWGIIKEYTRDVEIVSIMGTLSQDDCHIHISFTDTDCNTVWWHLKDGSKVYVTCEVVLLEFTDVLFSREPDTKTGFNELVVRQIGIKET